VDTAKRFHISNSRQVQYLTSSLFFFANYNKFNALEHQCQGCNRWICCL
jgi:hypothetical protein